MKTIDIIREALPAQTFLFEHNLLFAIVAVAVVVLVLMALIFIGEERGNWRESLKDVKAYEASSVLLLILFVFMIAYQSLSAWGIDAARLASALDSKQFSVRSVDGAVAISEAKRVLGKDVANEAEEIRLSMDDAIHLSKELERRKPGFVAASLTPR